MSITLPQLRIAQIGNGTHHLLEDYVQRHAGAENLLKEPPYDIVVLDLPQQDEARVLQTLRSQPQYSHALIYGIRGNNGLCKALGDGLLPSTEQQLLLEFRTWSERYETIKDRLALASTEFQALSCFGRDPNASFTATRHPARLRFTAIPCWNFWHLKAANKIFSGRCSSCPSKAGLNPRH